MLERQKRTVHSPHAMIAGAIGSNFGEGQKIANFFASGLFLGLLIRDDFETFRMSMRGILVLKIPAKDAKD